MPYQSIGDSPVNVMINQFDISNWYDNDELDLYESIDLIKDYYDEMTNRLRRRILEAPPHARIRRQVGIIEKVEQN
jgi:hypothetical protein